MAVAHQWQTGSAHSSASRVIAAKPSADPAPRWAITTGRSASAIQRASVSTSAMRGPVAAGVIEGGAAWSISTSSHSTSRGRLR